MVTLRRRVGCLPILTPGELLEQIAGVAMEAGKFGAFDGAVAEDTGELILGHSGDGFKGQVENLLAGDKLGDGCDGGSGVMGTEVCTGITSVYSMSDIEPPGEGPAALYGQVGETSSAVKDGGGNTLATTERTGRTPLDTPPTVPTVKSTRGGWLKIDRCKD